MIVKAWNNGVHHPDGNGYGIKISSHDRDQYFDPDWERITVELDGDNKLIEITIGKKSFWNKTCRELISKEIGNWLIKNHLGQWQPQRPPELELQRIGERRFHLSVLKQN